MTNTTTQTIEAHSRHYCRQASLVPAAGGTEQPFVTRLGARVMYCWDPSISGRDSHCYVNLDTDVILADCELAAHGL